MIYDRKFIEGGGGFLYVKEELNPVQSSSIKTGEDVESVWVEILDKNKSKIRIGGFYRPPLGCSKGGFPKLLPEIKIIEQKLLNELECASKRGTTIAIGDFNYRDIDWDIMRGSQNSQQFIDRVEDIGLFQFIKEPTRDNAILDLIFSNEEHLVSDVTVGDTLGTSDHNIVRFSLNFSMNLVKNTVLIPDFSKANMKEFVDELNLVDWDLVLGSETSTNEKWINFKTKLDKIQNNHIPLKEIRNIKKFQPKWFNKEAKKSKRMKEAAFKKLKQSNYCLENLESYREKRDNYSKVLRNCKRRDQKYMADNSKQNPKAFYKYFSHIKKSKVGPLEVDGKCIDKDEDMVHVLNDYRIFVAFLLEKTCKMFLNLVFQI